MLAHHGISHGLCAETVLSVIQQLINLNQIRFHKMVNVSSTEKDVPATSAWCLFAWVINTEVEAQKTLTTSNKNVTIV